MSINDEGPPPKRRTISKREAGEETGTEDMDRVEQRGSEVVSSEKSSSSEKISTQQSSNQQPIDAPESESESDQEVEAEETTSSSGSDSDESAEGEHSESEDKDSDEENPSGDDLDDPLSSQGQQRPTALPPIGERSGLRSRLQEFLPQLQKANADLESSSDNILDKRIDHVDDGAEQYIEMNLGLGVLSEQRPGEDDEVKLEPTTDTSSDQGTDEDDEAEQRMESSAEDVLARLRGEKAQKASKRKVEELG
ncbi:hypothetical protein ABEF93_002754 [Exophiala dermatitidis]